MAKVLELVSGYDRRPADRREKSQYRPMTVEEAKDLCRGARVPFLATDGTVRKVKVIGYVGTWKRDSSRVEVPLKYGLYEFGMAHSLPDGTMELLLVKIEAGE
mgnify:CR=1 FL=1